MQKTSSDHISSYSIFQYKEIELEGAQNSSVLKAFFHGIPIGEIQVASFYNWGSNWKVIKPQGGSKKLQGLPFKVSREDLRSTRKHAKNLLDSLNDLLKTDFQELERQKQEKPDDKNFDKRKIIDSCLKENRLINIDLLNELESRKPEPTDTHAALSLLKKIRNTKEIVTELSKEEHTDSKQNILERLTRFESRILAVLAVIPRFQMDSLRDRLNKEDIAKLAYQCFKKSIVDCGEGKSIERDNENIILQVELFFRRTFRKFIKHGNAPLPMWFHATTDTKKKLNSKANYEPTESEKTPFKSMVNTRTLNITSDGTVAKGAYISSNDEKIFGTITFAFDNDAVKDKEAEIFHPGYNPTYPPPIYAAIKAPIKITKKKVAYIAADEGVYKYAEDVLKINNCKIPLISRKASDRICESFNQVFQSDVRPRRNFPDKWMESYGDNINHPAFGPTKIQRNDLQRCERLALELIKCDEAQEKLDVYFKNLKDSK